MKIILQNKTGYVLRFDKGEEVLSEMIKFLKAQNVSACVFNGLGACSECEMGYFNPNVKDYRKKPFYDDMEIVCLNGNAGLKDGEPFVHAHGIFGKTDFSLIGGHVFKIIVSVTCEIVITTLDGALERKLDEDFNLNLLV